LMVLWVLRCNRCIEFLQQNNKGLGKPTVMMASSHAAWQQKHQFLQQPNKVFVQPIVQSSQCYPRCCMTSNPSTVWSRGG